VLYPLSDSAPAVSSRPSASEQVNSTYLLGPRARQRRSLQCSFHCARSQHSSTYVIVTESGDRKVLVGTMPTPRFVLQMVALAAVSESIFGCRPRSESLDIAGASYAFTGDLCPVHDPSFSLDSSGTFHMFTTDPAPGPPFIPHRCSSDGRTWNACGHVFDVLPSWVTVHVPNATALWAPDISFFNGSWWLLYAASTFGSQVSLSQA
jgi:hypothetical protein